MINILGWQENYADVSLGHQILYYEDYLNNISDILGIVHNGLMLMSIKDVKEIIIASKASSQALLEKDDKIIVLDKTLENNHTTMGNLKKEVDKAAKKLNAKDVDLLKLSRQKRC